MDENHIELFPISDEAMHFLDKSSFLSCMKNWMESEDVDLLTVKELFDYVFNSIEISFFPID